MNTKERPMLFSTAMVQAISAHNKRLTRRTRNLEGINANPNDYHAHINYMESVNINASFMSIKDNTIEQIKCPYGNPGDVIEVKNGADNSATNIWLKIETVSICRLQNLTREEAVMEGVEMIETDAMPVYRDYLDKNNFHHDPINSFRSLWISINGERSWNINPWVWEIKFHMMEMSDVASRERKEVSHG